MVEIAKLASTGIFFAGFPYLGTFFERPHKYFFDAESLSLERKRELENLHCDVSKRLMRLKLILYDVKSGLGAG
jgi:hypothetical protein